MLRASASLVVLAAAATACGSGPAVRTRAIDDGHTPGDRSATRALHVEGNALVADGRVVRLVGVNHSGSEYACVGDNGIFEGPNDATLPKAMARWHIDTVRVPLNEDCWLGINGAPPRYSGEPYRKAVVDHVAMLRDNGMYVILDLHWSAPGSTLAKHQQAMADLDHAPDFWRGVAAAFAHDAGVLFDLYNEPFVSTDNAETGDPWACWKNGCTITKSPDVAGTWKSAGMQQLVDAVRSTGARNIVLVGGLAYANDLSGWLAHRPSDPIGQLAASFHVYNFNACKDAACWASHVAPVANAVPLVTGELGEDDCAHEFVGTFMPWADARGVSYLGWTWNTSDCKKGPALITSYDGTPTPFGVGMKAHFLSVGR